MNDNWTKEELQASVEAYLDMQNNLKAGKKLIKKEYYRALSKKFGRTEKSYEYRMQNISYVLFAQGRDWIDGLRPAKNVGTKVASEIEEILAKLEGRAKSDEAIFLSKVQAEIAKKNLSKPAGIKKPKTISSSVTLYERDPAVKAWILINSKGNCECCEMPAPFTTADGMPFLEVHHIRRLADQGSDTIENAAALCPNCHRELHYGQNSRKLIENLYSKIKRLVPE